MDGAEERREASRLMVTAEIVTRGHKGAVSVVLRNISRFGAELTSAEPLGALGQYLELLLPSVREEISVMSEIVRSDRRETGHEIAVRFLDAGAKATGALRELLDLLSGGSGGGGRAHPRVALRLPICVRDARSVEHTGLLEDVSRGGAAVIVEAQLEIGEALTIAIPDARGIECVLCGVVVNQRPNLPEGFRLGVRFANDPLTSGNVDALVAYLLHQ